MAIRKLFVILRSKNNKIMLITEETASIVSDVSEHYRVVTEVEHRSTNNLTVQKQPTKSASTTERVMASTMSVDEYFDELITKVHEDYANL